MDYLVFVILVIGPAITTPSNLQVAGHARTMRACLDNKAVVPHFTGRIELNLWLSLR